jgi:alkanesulfonate monooxygenase
MPVEFVGGLFPRNQLAPRSAYRAPIDLVYLRDLARAHEHAGFDRVLIASGGGDPAVLAGYAAAHTERLGFMIAHRPGVAPPVQAARAFATLDQVTGGRIRLHTITGFAPEAEYGDTLADKAERYARADEYLQIVRRTWTEDTPFDFDGKYYSLRNAFSPIKPLQKPHIPVSLGGSSDAAYRVAVRHTDLYALWAEPLADTAERIAKLRSIAAAEGKPAPRVSLSVRLIIGPTEDIAWERARAIVAALERNTAQAGGLPGGDRGQSGGGQRQLALAARGEVFDKALFVGTSAAIGGGTDSTSLVGTPETIIEALLAYHDIGVTTFLTRGYDPLHDAIDYGRYIIGAVREEITRRELAAA